MLIIIFFWSDVDYHLEEGLLVKQVDKMTVNLNEGKEKRKKRKEKKKKVYAQAN